MLSRINRAILLFAVKTLWIIFAVKLIGSWDYQLSINPEQTASVQYPISLKSQEIKIRYQSTSFFHVPVQRNAYSGEPRKTNLIQYQRRTGSNHFWKTGHHSRLAENLPRPKCLRRQLRLSFPAVIQTAGFFLRLSAVFTVCSRHPMQKSYPFM